MNGSRVSFFISGYYYFSGRVPNRRGIGALGRGHGNFRRHFDAEVFRVVRSPARRGNLDHAHVVERAQCRIEVRIFPNRDEFACADRVGPCRVRHINSIAYVSLAPAIRVNLSSA